MFLKVLEIFTLVTGLIYVWLQVRQSNWMWPVDILSCIAAATTFFAGHLWANFGLNVYYILMAFWGMYAWLRDSRKVEEGELHLRKPSKRIWIVSVVLTLAGGTALIQVLRLLGDPAPVMDGTVGILGVVGCWWLANSYLENWLIWIVADSLTIILCLTQGLYWLAGLSAVYVAAAVWGYRRWSRLGKYV